MLKVLCVRTGDKYSWDYVAKLQSMVARHLPFEHEFICYSDSPGTVEGPTYKTTTLNGWWGKLDAMAEQGPCIYFDLDTIILRDLTAFANAVVALPHDAIMMLIPFRKILAGIDVKGWLSGIMAWGDTGFPNVATHYRHNGSRFKGDQDFLSDLFLRGGQVQVVGVQDALKVASYKWQCKRHGPPEGTEVVCFHGNPRPHQVADLPWVRFNWR